jgi:hypothetical protein
VVSGEIQVGARGTHCFSSSMMEGDGAAGGEAPLTVSPLTISRPHNRPMAKD